MADPDKPPLHVWESANKAPRTGSALFSSFQERPQAPNGAGREHDGNLLDAAPRYSDHGPMSQLTLRVSEQFASEMKAAARASRQSVTQWAMAALRAALTRRKSPSAEAEAIRERLARAGLLAEEAPRRPRRPPRAVVAQARAAAGKGRALSELVSEDRR